MIIRSIVSVAALAIAIPAAAQDQAVRELQLGRALEIRPKPIPKGNVGGHPCLTGSYTHFYETTGREGWLCCIPIAEILSDDFKCADSLFPLLLGSPEDMKIRFCGLAHPTSASTYVPVCIPAPLKAPEPPACNYQACPEAYRSFNASDCSYQPSVGPRRQCRR